MNEGHGHSLKFSYGRLRWNGFYTAWGTLELKPTEAFCDPGSQGARSRTPGGRELAEVAVIIPHYNDTVRLLRCLEALAPQFAAAPGRAETVIVDNGSTDPLDAVRAAAAALPGVRVVAEGDRGAATARNRGVAATGAPVIAFLDSDCVPDPDWLATLLRLAPGLGSGGDAELLGGRIGVFDETPPPRTGAEAFETVFAFDNRSYVGRKGFSVTANLVTLRRVFEAVGPLVGGVSEDLDWCRRAVAAGYRLAYADELSVTHPTRSDWSALERKWRRMTVEGFGSNGGGPLDRLRWAGRALIMPASIVAHAPRVLCHPELSGQERRRALETLARLRLRRCVWMLRQALGGEI